MSTRPSTRRARAEGMGGEEVRHGRWAREEDAVARWQTSDFGLERRRCAHLVDDGSRDGAEQLQPEHGLVLLCARCASVAARVPEDCVVDSATAKVGFDGLGEWNDSREALDRRPEAQLSQRLRGRRRDRGQIVRRGGREREPHGLDGTGARQHHDAVTLGAPARNGPQHPLDAGQGKRLDARGAQLLDEPASVGISAGDGPGQHVVVVRKPPSTQGAT